VQAYERALRLEPGNPSHLERLGAILLISGDAARAEQAFRALLSKDPADRTALLGLLTALWLPCELDPSSAMDGTVPRDNTKASKHTGTIWEWDLFIDLLLSVLAQRRREGGESSRMQTPAGFASLREDQINQP